MIQPIHPVTKTINNHTAAFMSLFFASLYTQIAIINATTNQTIAKIMGIINKNPNAAKGSGKVNSIFFFPQFYFYTTNFLNLL